MKLVIDCPN